MGMSFLLGLLAAKGLGALVGTLLLLTRVGPGFADPALAVENDSIYLTTTLKHAFSRHLDELLESGSVVAIAYTATVHVRDRTGQVHACEPSVFLHSAIYDPVSQSFTVYRSELTGRPDSLVNVETLDRTKELLAYLHAPLQATASLPPDRELYCRIEAALNTIRIEPMGDQELDLNAFWDYRYPKAATRWLKLETP